MEGLFVHFFLFIILFAISGGETNPILPSNLKVISSDETRKTTHYTRTTDDMIVIDIPANEFYAGSEKPLHYEHEKPSLNIKLSRFLIDQREVSVAQYNLCIKAGKCQKPIVSPPEYFPDTNQLPIVGISHPQALQYCQWVQMTLPTEVQWEFAARGVYSTIYPWGNNLHERKTARPIIDHLRIQAGNPPVPTAVDSIDEPSTASYFGLLHLAGNVSEWTLDYAIVSTEQELQPRKLSDEEKRTHRSQNYVNKTASPYRIIKGANYLTSFPVFQRASYRSFALENEGHLFLGFRCALELP